MGTRQQQRTTTMDNLQKEIEKYRVSDDALFVHVYTTTSAKGSLRPGTKARIQIYLGSKILDGHPS